MNIHEFAKMLNGREYGNEITTNEINNAKELGFVVLFGASDDLAEFRGAINDEVGCFNGGEAYLDNTGILEECEENCKYYIKAKEKTKEIKIICESDEGYFWTYQTDMPHATFEIAEDGELYCRGIVFDIKSLKEVGE